MENCYSYDINNQFYLFLFLSNGLNLFSLNRKFDKKLNGKLDNEGIFVILLII